MRSRDSSTSRRAPRPAACRDDGLPISPGGGDVRVERLGEHRRGRRVIQVGHQLQSLCLLGLRRASPSPPRCRGSGRCDASNGPPQVISVSRSAPSRAKYWSSGIFVLAYRSRPTTRNSGPAGPSRMILSPGDSEPSRKNAPLPCAGAVHVPGDHDRARRRRTCPGRSGTSRPGRRSAARRSRRSSRRPRPRSTVASRFSAGTRISLRRDRFVRPRQGSRPARSNDGGAPDDGEASADTAGRADVGRRLRLAGRRPRRSTRIASPGRSARQRRRAPDRRARRWMRPVTSGEPARAGGRPRTGAAGRGRPRAYQAPDRPRSARPPLPLGTPPGAECRPPMVCATRSRVSVLGRADRVHDGRGALLEVQVRRAEHDGVGAGQHHVGLHRAGRQVGLGLLGVGQVLEHRLAAGPDVDAGRRGGVPHDQARLAGVELADVSLTNGVIVGSPSAVRWATRLMFAPPGTSASSTLRMALPIGLAGLGQGQVVAALRQGRAGRRPCRAGSSAGSSCR